MAKTKVLNYNLFIYGIFGRNRTNKATSYRLATAVDPATPLPLCEVMLLAEAKIVLAKIKSGMVKVTEDPVEREEIVNPDGTKWTCETFALFSETELHKRFINFTPILKQGDVA